MRIGRRRARREEPWVQAFGPEWWLKVSTMSSRQTAAARTEESKIAAKRLPVAGESFPFPPFPRYA